MVLVLLRPCDMHVGLIMHNGFIYNFYFSLQQLFLKLVIFHLLTNLPSQSVPHADTIF